MAKLSRWFAAKIRFSLRNCLAAADIVDDPLALEEARNLELEVLVLRRGHVCRNGQHVDELLQDLPDGGRSERRGRVVAHFLATLWQNLEILSSCEGARLEIYVNAEKWCFSRKNRRCYSRRRLSERSWKGAHFNVTVGEPARGSGLRRREQNGWRPMLSNFFSNLWLILIFFANVERPVLGCIEADILIKHSLDVGSNMKKRWRKSGTHYGLKSTLETEK